MLTLLRTCGTPMEHYDVLDRALTEVLRAGGARASPELMDRLAAYDQHLRAALGLHTDAGAAG